jgi:hypothetical protein
MSGTTGASPVALAPNNYTAANNMSDRMNLLAYGTKMTKNLNTVSSQGGSVLSQQLQMRLFNVGLITQLRIRVTASVTITATATASPLGPYALLSRITLADYNTTQRVACTGPMLYFFNSMKHGRPWLPTGQGLVDTAQVQLPTAIGANQTLQFELLVPVAVDPHNDLTGAIYAQTTVGEQYLQVLINNAMVGDVTCPYTEGTVTLNSVTMQVWQDYIQPNQYAPNVPLIDANTVYEFAANFTSTTDIVANGKKYINYPNVRSVLAHYFFYVDNGTLTPNETDITSLVLQANGNTNMREMDPLLVRADMRNALGGDLPASLFYYGHRRNPISTFIFSQVQNIITFSGAVVAGSYIAYGFESTYGQSTPLPGIAYGA